MMTVLTWMVRLLPNTPESIAMPRSVKAYRKSRRPPVATSGLRPLAFGFRPALRPEPESNPNTQSNNHRVSEGTLLTR